MARKHIPFFNLIFAASLASALFLSSGCADEPSPVGSFLLPGGDLVGVDSVIIISNETYGEKAIPFSLTAVRSTLAIGKSDNFEAWTFLRFLGFPDSLNNAVIQSAEVSAHTLYHLGDSLGTVSFSVHKTLSDWNRETFVYDSLSRPGVFDPTGTNENLGSVGDGASLLFPIDTSIVREWIRAVSDTTYKNFGVVLQPTNSTVIKGFRSGNSDSTTERPVLTVRFIMNGSARIDTVVLRSVIDKFVAGSADTTFLRDSTLIPVRGGAAYRGVLGLNVTAIPAHAAIHRAFLDLTVDNIFSRRATNQHDSLLALYAGVRNPIQIGTPMTVSGNTVYRFNVTEFVQAVVRGIGDAHIRLSVFDEENTVGSFMMHGAAASNSALRPKITVLYSPTR